MKHLSFFTFLLVTFLTLNLKAQKTTEFGILLGRSYYLGEINPTTHYGDGVGSFTYGATFRYNLNKRYSLKATLAKTTLQAEDRFSDLEFNQARMAKFENNLTDFATTIEFNFLPFSLDSRQDFFSPYLFVGLNLYRSKPSTTINEVEVNQGEIEAVTKMAYLFGPGLKLSVGRKLHLSFEWGFRKTSDDAIDGLPNRMNEVYELGKNYDNDWYVMSNFMLTYKLTDLGPCPAYNF
jgi:opacity protein-like surface antigen